MIRLLKIEFHKILYYRTFWIILGLYIVLIAPIAFGFESILSSFVIHNGKPGQSSLSSLILGGYSVFDFPEVWLNLAYLASWFKLLLAIIVVIMVTNEYSYRTLRQNIMDGMSKWEIIKAKELVIVVLSLMATLLLVTLTLVLGNYKGNTNIFEGSGIIFAYFFSLMLYLNFAYFISAWLKRSGFVIGMLFLYTLIIENLISWKLPDYISDYFPMNLISRMIPNPLGKLLGKSGEYDFSPITVGVCLGYIALFIFLNYRMLKRGHAGK
jgi:ABC-2 type transport system permease protein